MILLDTDHASVLQRPAGDRRSRLVARIALADDALGVPVVVVEEMMRGWLSAIAKERSPHRQIFAYRELGELFDFFADFDIIPFTEAAADILGTLGRVQIGTMDKKIASITLANNALLLTANRSDFQQIPGLRHENWMD